MKTTNIFLALALLLSTFTFAQVGIGTVTPEGALDVVSATNGLVLPRVANTSVVVNANNAADVIAFGTMVYDISSECVKVYEATTGWSQCLNTDKLVNPSTNGTGVVTYGTAAGCTAPVFSPGLTEGVDAAGTTMTIQANVTTLGTYNITAGPTNGVTFTGSGTFSATGCQDAVLTASGTPIAAGSTSFTTNTTPSETGAITVANNGDATFSLPQTHSVVSVFDAGPPVVDIQGVVDNSTNQIVFTVPYTGGAGNYDAYTSTPITVTGHGGDENTLSISYAAGTFSTSGNLTVTVTVGPPLAGSDTSFNVTKQGFGITATFATLDLQVNGNSKGNLLLDAVGGILDRNFADANHKFIYLPITNVDGKVWLNNNLGANYANLNHVNFSPTTQATSSTDYDAYGSLMQWGRYSDGHELINWTSGTASDGVEQANETSTNSTTTSVPSPDTSKFILEPNSPFNWYTGTSPDPDTLWQGEAGTNNVCPQGYKVPTEAEWDSVRLTDNTGATVATNNWGTATNYGSNGAAGGLASTLKLPLPGRRLNTTGALDNVGTHGAYWSSTVDTTNARALSIRSTSAIVQESGRATGFSVRCLKDQ
jgi:uncharacterized protein (TIGR02145 family)